MSSNKILFIVESPGKIKKIQTILGNEYIVDASKGHVMDIPSDKMNIDIENNFEPIYKVKPGYVKIVNSLKNAVKKTKFTILAMDEDREGEAIAYGLVMALKLKKGTYNRVVFNEITKKAIMKGIDNSRPIDYNLVWAQKARRVLDKYIGYSLSPCLWGSIMPGKLSAGRVQSIVSRIIVDKEREIEKFFENGANTFFRTNGYFTIPKKSYTLESVLYKKEKNKKGQIAKIEGEENIIKFLKKCKKSEYVIADISDKISYKNPSPPLITSSLQQEASNKHGFSPKITMSIAQSLYEKGHITYMRTDSTSLSDTVMEEIKKYVEKKFGKEYYRKKQYKSKVKNAQEAHEAIRPTHIDVEGIEDGTEPEKKLYSLIWKITVASQMSPAEINNTFIQIDIIRKKEKESMDYYFETKFEEIMFQGFLKLYDINNKDKDLDFKKLKLKVKQKLDLDKIQAKQDYDRPPNRFTEAMMVKYLEKNGIGRPSTYATMVDKVIQKNYAEKTNVKGYEKDSQVLTLDGETLEIEQEIKKVVLGKENNKLVPTSLGIQVTDYLLERFDQVMDYKFTAKIEDKLDNVSNGEKVWYKVLNKFNKTFAPKVEKEMKINAENKKDKKEGTYNDPNKRVLGTDENTGYEVIATKGPHGSFVKLVGPTKGNSKSGPIKTPLTLKKITYEQAMEILKYPYELGKYENKKIIVKKGEYGLYAIWNKQNMAIEDGLTLEQENKLTVEKIEELIKAKNKNIINKLTGGKGEIYTILSGEYGPFVNMQKGKTKRNISLKSILNKSELEESDYKNQLKNITVEQIEDVIKKSYGKKKYQKKIE